MKVQFKTKLLKDNLGNQLLKVPSINRSHCDMSAFRSSRRFGWASNSELFNAIISREVNKIIGSQYIDMAKLPENVSVSQGFLSTVIIEVQETI